MPGPAKVVVAVGVFVAIDADVAVAVADTAVGRSKKKKFFQAGTEQRLSFLETLTCCSLMRWSAFV